MGPIEQSQRETFSPALFGGEYINTYFRKILGHNVNCFGLGPWSSAEIAYNTSNSNSGELVEYILGGTSLNYVGHKDGVRGANEGARKEWKYVEMVELARQKEMAGGQDRNRLHR